jgi:hypothetical protein
LTVVTLGGAKPGQGDLEQLAAQSQGVDVPGGLREVEGGLGDGKLGR